MPRPKRPRAQIGARIPDDLMAAVDAYAVRTGLSPSEVLREALTQFVYGASSTQEPSDGYAQARRNASRMARAAMAAGLEAIPTDAAEAEAWLADYERRFR